jgi:hypothetical protein
MAVGVRSQQMVRGHAALSFPFDLLEMRDLQMLLRAQRQFHHSLQQLIAGKADEITQDQLRCGAQHDYRQQWPSRLRLRVTREGSQASLPCAALRQGAAGGGFLLGLHLEILPRSRSSMNRAGHGMQQPSWADTFSRRTNIFAPSRGSTTIYLKVNRQWPATASTARLARVFEEQLEALGPKWRGISGHRPLNGEHSHACLRLATAQRSSYESPDGSDLPRPAW